VDKIAILIPCYNEEKTIFKVVKDCRTLIPDASVYVYDNNSSDNTVSEAEKAGAIIRYERQQGKGNVIRRMFREIDAECYLMLDGDDTYPLESAPEMISQVLDRGADMVVGDRLSSSYFTENKRAFHNMGNRLVRGSINLLFSSKIKDIMTGFRAFSYEFVKTFPVISKGFEIETEMTIHAISHNMQVENIIVDYRDRPEGSESKLNTYIDGVKVLSTIFNLFKNHRPFLFFGILALILIVLAVSMFIPSVLIPFLRTGLVEKFPTLIVCVFLSLFSVFSFYTGLILDTMRYSGRCQFEFNLQLISDEKKRKRCENERNA